MAILVALKGGQVSVGPDQALLGYILCIVVVSDDSVYSPLQHPAVSAAQFGERRLIS
jgi:hypothetical protein